MSCKVQKTKATKLVRYIDVNNNIDYIKNQYGKDNKKQANTLIFTVVLKVERKSEARKINVELRKSNQQQQ